MQLMSAAAEGSSLDASGEPTQTGWKEGDLMSLDGTGVAGRDEERLCLCRFSLRPPNMLASMLPRGVVEGVAGREMGGVGGTSPVTVANAWTLRQSIFIAVSGKMSLAFHCSVELGGEGIAAMSIGSDLMQGISPVSSEGLGGSGGEAVTTVFIVTGWLSVER